MGKKAKKVGRITHFFDRIQVAVVEVTAGKLKTGDLIKISNKSGEEFVEQTVGSMQVNHKPVEIAKKGDEVGMKMDGMVKEGWEVSLM